MTTQQRIDTSQRLGDIYELERAPQLFDQLGWDYQPSTTNENRFSKFDYRVTPPGKPQFRLEVKGPKKPHGLVLFEAVGITGHDGWGLGAADYVLQFLEDTVAIAYKRKDMLARAIELGGEIPKSPVRLPAGQFANPGVWQGRSGKNRRGLPQQDCFILLTPEHVKGLYRKLKVES
jgi:hypothetical protein